ncbi:DUF31 family protein [Mycoplasmopsis bovis]|uniref:MAG2960 family serine endopeptidase lipoprotein n=1 Tax=Mycoplasmopsis bovis TaxID=28903 RepID=UPI00094B5F13|nr:hypothetical protein [Mycoplasmopsis bovis]MBT1317943.1 hypothetical protein [Mycoplasmopsis bovis]MCA8841625.1 hypothetical protein [Mycoplasmopsis bovis]MCA8844702.1 hypothetical protein [Mycoplasmopsis bovis]MCA8845504.1 hypothetical protein [Mycoplasmopsis bovis]MCA8847046.1 hypothetical protein [Mycoplasmopsis bovis]
MSYIKLEKKFKLLLGTITSAVPLSFVLSCTNNKEQNSDTDAKTPIKQADKHFLAIDQLIKLSPREIHSKTKTYIEKNKEFKNFLKTRNINFISEEYPRHENELDKEYWTYAKYLGEYGNHGDDSYQKTQFFNPSIPIGHYLNHQHLEKFSEEEVKDLKVKTIDLSSLIRNNPFGYLPSNLSQLLSYATYESIEKKFNLRNISNIKTSYDDIKGVIYLLISTNNNKNKHYYLINKDNNKELKANIDFFTYIKDRSIELNVNAKQWVSTVDQQKNISGIFNFPKFLGTAWVIDRIKNNNNNNNHYELLLATNMHVFNLRSTFDKTYHYDKFKKYENYKDKDYGWKEFPPGFYDGIKTNDSGDNRNIEPKPAFKVNRIKENSLDLDFGVFEKNKYKYELDHSDRIDAFEDAYAQYLDAPYYTPRYESNNTYLKAIEKNPETLKNNFSYFNTKNSGADFLTLRLKIKKDKLKDVLPKLASVIGTDEEKDFYVNFSNKEFSPIKTQFYAGYSRHWDPFSKKSSQFRGVKSEGGIISTKRRIVDENWFRDVWLRYDEKLNKEYNSENNLWEKYQQPFIKKKDKDDKYQLIKEEHGMPLTTLDQFSTLYTNIPFGDLNLKEGASGSMAIDSSFNVIGILNTRVDNVIGDKKVIKFDKPYGKDGIIDGIVVRPQTNGIVLFKSLSDDYIGKEKQPFIIDGLKNKLINDKLETIKLNPNSK